MRDELIQEFIEQSQLRFNENLPRIEKCLAELSEEDIWRRPNDASNSIGNLILHLCGNIRQYIISSLGAKEDVRQRNQEFAAKGGLTKSELLNLLNSTVHEAAEVIKAVDEVSLLKVRSVQGFRYSGIGIIIHVVEHYSYHTGQIAFWTKLLKNKDLGFYANLDLSVRNE